MAKSPKKSPENEKKKSPEKSPEQVVIMREVEDAVLKDQARSLWQSHGRWLVAVVVTALSAYGAVLLWQDHLAGERGDDAEVLVLAQTALAESAEGNAATAQASKADLERLRAEGIDSYPFAATLTLANETANKQGDPQAAAAMLGELTSDSELDLSLKNLTTIRQTLFEFDSLDPQVIIARMRPILDQKEPVSGWQPLAIELSAMAHYRANNREQAAALYEQISTSETAPESMKARAKQMILILTSDKKKSPTNAATTEG